MVYMGSTFRGGRGGKKDARKIYKNDEIKAFNILLIDETGEKVGVIPRAKALAMATERGLDLVQLSYDPKERVSTAKIIDFGKYQYEKKKNDSEKKKRQKKKGQKEVKFGYNIGEHDLEMKMKKAIDFLGKGYNLRVTVVLRGREKVYKSIARTRLDVVEEKLSEHGKSQGIKEEGYGFSLMIFSTVR